MYSVILYTNTIDAKNCMEAFDDVWLSRYPRPQYLGHDNGEEFKNVFSEMRQNCGMTKKNLVVPIILNQME